METRYTTMKKSNVNTLHFHCKAHRVSSSNSAGHRICAFV